MLQEIITYIIIGLALFFAVRKIVLKFRKKRKRRPEACSTKPSLGSNCYDCPADCAFRQQTDKIILKRDSLNGNS
jgi:hypothetical protein